jgi:hypothetical protein
LIKVLFYAATPSTCLERRPFGRRWRWNPQRQFRPSTSFSVAPAVPPNRYHARLARLQGGELALAQVAFGANHWQLARGSCFLDANAPFEPKSCDQNQDTRTKCAPKRLDNIFRIVEIGATQTDEVGLVARGAPT